MITYLWVKHKRENKKAKIIDNGEFGKFVTLLNLNDLPGFVKKKEYIGFEKIFFSKNYILLKKKLIIFF